MLTQEESEALVHQAVTQANWKDLCLAWTTCEQTFLRGDSLQKMFLPDLLCNRTHGPMYAPNKIDPMIAYIYRRNVHKEQSFNTREVGAYRHKNWIRCCIGHLAMNLFAHLNADGQIHFKRSLGERADWWKVKLIQDWNDCSSHQAAFETLLASLDISWDKKTHLCKQGIEYASSRGQIDEDTIGTLSKHKTQKIA